MQTEYLIPLQEFCTKHEIEVSFISSLQKTGLLEIITIEAVEFINISQLQQLEKCISFYYELDINLEGIETISHLLNRIETLQKQIVSLKNRLSLYEKQE